MVTQPCSELFRDRSKISWRDRETFSIICICRIVSADFWTAPYTSLGVQAKQHGKLIAVQYPYFFSLREGEFVMASSVSCSMNFSFRYGFKGQLQHRNDLQTIQNYIRSKNFDIFALLEGKKLEKGKITTLIFFTDYLSVISQLNTLFHSKFSGQFRLRIMPFSLIPYL